MSGSVRVEKQGTPVVFIVTDNFIHDAKSSAEDNGIPKLRMVTLPADEYYRHRINQEEIRPMTEKVFNKVIDALIQPLSDIELSPTFKESTPAETVTISAPDYDSALEIFNQAFLDNKWGSGLPMMPPTRERVDWILSGTPLPRDKSIGQLAPKNGIATVEKIAINAAMAGARPEYLPTIIAAIQAISDPRFDLLHMTASTGSFGLQIMISGSIGQELEMNSGIGMLGYGWRANNTIGHAIRLCLINLGHVWPAENDMALIGRTSSHTCNVFAENMAQSPWKPYHANRGFEPDENCVTVSITSPFTTFAGTSVIGGGAVDPWTASSILETMISTVGDSRASMKRWKLGSPIPSPPHYFFVLHPKLAMELNQMGYDQNKLQTILFERSAVPYDDLTSEEVDSVRRRIDNGEIPDETIGLCKENMVPGGHVPLLRKSEDCHIAVAGGIPGYSFVSNYFAVPPYTETSVMTKKIIH